MYWLGFELAASQSIIIIITIPASKEPAGLCTRDGKRPDGLSLIPWQNGKPLAWDVTVASTLAESYVEAAARESGAVAEQAAQRKVE